MVQPTTWLLLALALLAGSQAAAQPQPPVRQRQDRSATLPAPPAEPLLELYMAADSSTTVVFDGRLDRDSLVVDRTRFKWVDVGDNILFLQLVADLGPGERLIVKIRFMDKGLPAQAILAIVTHSTLVDRSVEVDRRPNTPEALQAALDQRDVELEELKARCEGANPVALVLSEWLNEDTSPTKLTRVGAQGPVSGLKVKESTGYKGKSSALVAVRLRNLPGQPPWAVSQARITPEGGAPVPVLSVRMQRPYLAPNEEGLVVVELKTAPWATSKVLNVELVDASGQRRLSFNLTVK